MKKILIHLSNCLLLSMMLVSCSCCDDDKTEIKHDDAGDFAIINLNTGEAIDGSSANMLIDDTLKVEFTPKSEYQKKSFSVTCSSSSIKKLNDNLFLVSSVINDKVKFFAYSKEEDDKTITEYSAEKELTINVPSTYAIIPFHLEVSPDLLQLVTAEVNYKNGNGTQGTFVINDDDWIHQDSTTVRLYVDADGHEYYIGGSQTPEEGWVLQEQIKFVSNSIYDFKMRYYQLGVDNEIVVNYKPKTQYTLDKDTYYFNHSITRKSATIEISNTTVMDISSDFSVTINIGSMDSDVNKNDVKSYLDKLQNTPDVYKFNISDRGMITKY
ncbi:MAG: hypothetical protein IJK42_01710 [Prevotella sp.]|nr:hypothetical protein [Prevotella sp.]